MGEKLSALFTSAKENIGFILVCILIFAAVFLLAYLVERHLIRLDRFKRRTKYITCISMLSAVAGVLMTLEIPLFFAPAFYELDLSELPVLICAFSLGPVAGVVCELLKIIVKLVIKGTTSAFVGEFANFVIGCTFILPASIIYYIKKSKKMAIIGMTVGTSIMTVFGSMFNAIYLLPTFSKLYGMPLDNIIAMGTAVNKGINSVSTLVLFAVVPFNILKGIIVSTITLLIYKRVEKLLHINNKA